MAWQMSARLMGGCLVAGTEAWLAVSLTISRQTHREQRIHRSLAQPARATCLAVAWQGSEGPWFNSYHGALSSLGRPPRAKTGSPKCWERWWGFMVSCYLLVSFQFFRSGVFFSCVNFLAADSGPPGARAWGPPVHWTAWTCGFYASLGSNQWMEELQAKVQFNNRAVFHSLYQNLTGRGC